MRSRVVRFEEVEDSYYGGLRKMAAAEESEEDALAVSEEYEEEKEVKLAECAGVRVDELDEVLSIEVCETFAEFVVKRKGSE